MLSCVASLLLLGCLSRAEATRGDPADELSLNETPQALVTGDAQITQETSQPDLRGALRGMRALMTEQGVRLQAAVDRLADSEALIKGIVDMRYIEIRGVGRN